MDAVIDARIGPRAGQKLAGLSLLLRAILVAQRAGARSVAVIKTVMWYSVPT